MATDKINDVCVIFDMLQRLRELQKLLIQIDDHAANISTQPVNKEYFINKKL